MTFTRRAIHRDRIAIAGICPADDHRTADRIEADAHTRGMDRIALRSDARRHAQGRGRGEEAGEHGVFTR